MRALVVALLAGLLSTGGVGRALANEGHHAGEPVALTDLPSAAQKTFNRETKGAQLGDLRKVTKQDGSIAYKAEIVKGDTATGIAVSPEGKVLKHFKVHEEKAEHEKK
jgi:hypothetical protein